MAAKVLNKLWRNLKFMISILGWIFFGLIVGVLAKFVMPGKDPGGLILTIVLGIAGAVLGGWIGTSLGYGAAGQPAGWVMSILGAVLLLAVYRFLFNRTQA
jgi:uncharacterized membrane protein YeaQ/YmgE (transglycosylase-associated protein family)